MADGDHTRLKQQLIAAFEDTGEQSAQEFGRLALLATEVMSDEELDEIGEHFTLFIQGLDETQLDDS